MNITMKREDALQAVNELGMDLFIKALENQYELGLYKASTNWIEDERFNCKLKGSKGDLLIELKSSL